MQSQQISVKIELDPEASPHTVSPPEFGEALAKEIDAFEKWFMSQKNGPLVPSEKAMLKTYLAWKIRYEEAGMDAGHTEGCNG